MDVMINHTLLVQFTEPVPDADLDQYLADIEKAANDTGSLLSFAAQRHIRVPGEE
ncbi:acyl carrier protein phosphodiesterase [Streptomyces sp. LBL]|nr:acyl carrier protein phosphodiesterase [Streptomyces sp. LBL]